MKSKTTTIQIITKTVKQIKTKRNDTKTAKRKQCKTIKNQ